MVYDVYDDVHKHSTDTYWIRPIIKIKEGRLPTVSYVQSNNIKPHISKAETSCRMSNKRTQNPCKRSHSRKRSKLHFSNKKRTWMQQQQQNNAKQVPQGSKPSLLFEKLKLYSSGSHTSRATFSVTQDLSLSNFPHSCSHANRVCTALCTGGASGYGILLKIRIAPVLWDCIEPASLLNSLRPYP